MKKTVIFFLSILSFSTVLALSPKREMRAAWMATVWRIDWPGNVVSTTGKASEIKAQKDGMIRYLDSIKSANMNTVFLQVRSRCDAMYKSSYEPWSTDLVATRGMDPGYDPLAFAVDEAHKRGIELHAWLNPYRYETTDNQFVGTGDYRTTHPEWLLDYANGYAILNPGLPEVKQRITDVVREIVTNYDVDGIVFDDYFYAYGGTPSDLDLATQQLYKPSGMTVNDWRRKNINDMVLSVYNMIQDVKPYVTFGVGPFGIWTTDQTVAAKEGVPLPGGITGGNMYAEIYCDPVAWLKQGSVDYITPQLYWPTTSTGQDYDVLCPWWSNVALRFGKHFYSSQTLSGLTAYSSAPAAVSALPETTSAKISSEVNAFSLNGELIPMQTLSQFEKDLIIARNKATNVNVSTDGVKPIQFASSATAAVSPQEIGLQITRNRLSSKDGAPGSVFYSIGQLYTTGFTKYLRNNMFTNKSLAPAINWKPTQNYGMVNNLTINSNLLTWDNVDSKVRYTIYAIPNSKISDPASYQTSEFLLGFSYTNSFDVTNIDTNAFTMGVAVLDRYGNEFPVRLINQTISSAPATTLLYPSNGENVVFGTPFQVTFNWNVVDGIYAYYIEIASDNSFQNIVFSRELTGTSISSDLFPEFTNGATYYWRVKTRQAGSTDGISDVRTFSAQSFKVLYPTYDLTNVSVTPLVTWTSIGNQADLMYKMEISKDNTFATDKIVYTITTNSLEHQVPTQVLVASTAYYVKITATSQSTSISTSPIMFTTEALIPDIPSLILPNGSQGINGLTMNIKWNEDPRATSYRIEINKDNTFPPRSNTILSPQAFNYSVDYTVPSAGIYYVRIRANYGAGLYTSWSNVQTADFTLSGVNDVISGFDAKIARTDKDSYKLSLELNNSGYTTISLYTVTGVKLKNIYQGQLQQGSYSYPLNLGYLNKGVYFISIKMNSQIITKKIIL